MADIGATRSHWATAQLTRGRSAPPSTTTPATSCAADRKSGWQGVVRFNRGASWASGAWSNSVAVPTAIRRSPSELSGRGGDAGSFHRRCGRTDQTITDWPASYEPPRARAREFGRARRTPSWSRATLPVSITGIGCPMPIPSPPPPLPLRPRPPTTFVPPWLAGQYWQLLHARRWRAWNESFSALVLRAASPGKLP